MKRPISDMGLDAQDWMSILSGVLTLKEHTEDNKLTVSGLDSMRLDSQGNSLCMEYDHASGGLNMWVQKDG